MSDIKKGHTVLKAFVRLKIESLGRYTMINNLNMIMDKWYMHNRFEYQPTVISFWGIEGAGKARLIYRMKQMYKLESFFISQDYRDKKPLETLRIELEKLAQQRLCNRLVVSLNGFNKIKVKNNEERQFINDFIRQGTINTAIDSKTKEDIEKLLKELYFIVRAKLKVKNGIVIPNDNKQAQLVYNSLTRKKRLRRFNDLFKNTKSTSGTIKSKYPISKPLSFVDESFYKTLVSSSAFFNEYELRKKLHTLNAEETILLIKSIASNKYKKHQFFNTLILTSNELSYDYVEQMSNNIDINIVGGAKSYLKSSFNSEIFTSLGYNHLVFSNFETVTFEKLIRDRLAIIANNFEEEKQNIKIVFDNSVNNFFLHNYTDARKGATTVVEGIEKVLLSKLNRMLKRKSDVNVFVKIVKSIVVVE